MTATDEICGCGHPKSKHNFMVFDIETPPHETDACNDYSCVTQGGCGKFEPKIEQDEYLTGSQIQTDEQGYLILPEDENERNV